MITICLSVYFKRAVTKVSNYVSQPANEINLKHCDKSIIGKYGIWAINLQKECLPFFSLRRKEWRSIEQWRQAARKRTIERLSVPEYYGRSDVKVNNQYQYDGLHVEELSWRLPYGRPTEAVLLKPAKARKPLPGILAFHDHAGNKYFGKEKITRTDDLQNPYIQSHQQIYYDGNAWANEIAKRGYVVLVTDAFLFGSRRILLEDVPFCLTQGLCGDTDIDSYNKWSVQHEHNVAKSLFSAGTTLPGVFVGEDLTALDILCSRKDVDNSRIGCGGLSAGGLRTVFAAGLDSRIKCAVCVGFMTTWRDLTLFKSYKHTWMTYVPLLPNDLDFPEILGLGVPMPTLVINSEGDDLFTLNEMKNADKILKSIFKKANSSEKYYGSFYPGPHKFGREMQEEAFCWFDRWLN